MGSPLNDLPGGGGFVVPPACARRSARACVLVRAVRVRRVVGREQAGARSVRRRSRGGARNRRRPHRRCLPGSKDLRSRVPIPARLACENRRSQAGTALHREHKHPPTRSEEHTSELQSLAYLVCRLLLEKKKNIERAPDVNDNMTLREHSVQDLVAYDEYTTTS